MAPRPTTTTTTTTTTKLPDRVYITPKQAAEYAECSDQTIYRMIQAGELPASRIGGRRLLRIDTADLDAIMRPAGR